MSCCDGTEDWPYPAGSSSGEGEVPLSQHLLPQEQSQLHSPRFSSDPAEGNTGFFACCIDNEVKHLYLRSNNLSVLAAAKP